MRGALEIAFDSNKQGSRLQKASKLRRDKDFRHHDAWRLSADIAVRSRSNWSSPYFLSRDKASMYRHLILGSSSEGEPLGSPRPSSVIRYRQGHQYDQDTSQVREVEGSLTPEVPAFFLPFHFFLSESTSFFRLPFRSATAVRGAASGLTNGVGLALGV